MKKIIIQLFIVLFPIISFSQNLDDLDDYSVENFYKKIELDYGTLDEEGNEIEYIFVKTTVEKGKYNIELTDETGDLFNIKGTNIYIKFNTYFGYAGYSTECIMKVENYSSTVYKLE